MTDPFYNTTNFPNFVCHNGNWDIYGNAEGKCAAIPNELGERDGNSASHFGDLDHVRKIMSERAARAEGRSE